MKRYSLPAAAARLLFASASGVLFALSLPPRNIEWLGWLAFAPLLFALRDPRIRPVRQLPALSLGLVSGLVCGAAQVGWDFHRPAMLPFAYLPYIWIALAIGSVAAVATLVVRSPRRFVWVLTVAAAGVGVEYLTTFSPLPVGIALCQNRSLPIIQIADTFGIWGVSFLLWIVNAALADAFVRRKGTRECAAAALLAAASLLYGEAVLLRPAGRPITVAAVQDFSGGDAGGFAPTASDNSPAPEKEDLIREAAHRGAKLIVGTEEAWGSAFVPNDPDDAVSTLARETGSELVVGFQQPSGQPRARDYNSAALVGADGATIGIHHKIRLFLGERQTMHAGERASAWASPVGRVGLLICFDSCYTDSARQAVADGAQIIAMPNYDPPTPQAVLHNLHAALIPFRAVENRVAFIRADPNGMSQIISPIGQVVAQTPMYRAEALVAPVALGNGQGTLFTRYGDWFAYACAAFALLTIALARPKPLLDGAARNEGHLS